MTSFLTRRRLQGAVTGVAVAAVVLTTAACGGTTRGEEETTSNGGGAAASANPDAEIPEGLAVGFLPKQVNNPYFSVASAGAEDATREVGGEDHENGPSGAQDPLDVS